jgi:hypothetical protein
VFGRVVNFVLFSIAEPMLPAKPDRSEVAHAHTAEGSENFGRQMIRGQELATGQSMAA